VTAGIISAAASPPEVARFRPPPGEQLTPSGAKARVEANLAAIHLPAFEEEHRPATTDERQVLAAWSSCGAVPQVFDRGRDEFADEGAALEGLLTPAEFDAARWRRPRRRRWLRSMMPGLLSEAGSGRSPAIWHPITSSAASIRW